MKRNWNWSEETRMPFTASKAREITDSVKKEMRGNPVQRHALNMVLFKIEESSGLGLNSIFWKIYFDDGTPIDGDYFDEEFVGEHLSEYGYSIVFKNNGWEISW